MDPEIRVYNDLEGLSRAAAQLFFDLAEQAIRERGRFLAVINGGSTPKRLFQLLAGGKSGKITWEAVHIFWGDERCVPPDDAESNYGQARDQFLGHVAIPNWNVHRIPGELGPQAASKEYDLVLKKFASTPLNWPSFDLVFLGMGEDGHTASLFPGSRLDVPGPTMAVSALYQDRPAERVTLTPLVFNSSRMILFMAAGENKALTLSRVVNDGYKPELYPAQRIDPKGGKLIWLVDEAAASKLPKKLLKAV